MPKKYKKNKKEESESESDSDDFESDVTDESIDSVSEESEEVPRKKKSKKSRRDENTEVTEDDVVEGETVSEEEIVKINKKIRAKLKQKILDWLDDDDKIKEMNAAVKQLKDSKKAQEAGIIDMMTKLGMGDKKIDVEDNTAQVKGRVYRQKSVTKGAIKEDIIKDALMETIRDEKKVNQLVKKIENKRPINERYYLKRTKGEKN